MTADHNKNNKLTIRMFTRSVLYFKALKVLVYLSHYLLRNLLSEHIRIQATDAVIFAARRPRSACPLRLVNTIFTTTWTVVNVTWIAPFVERSVNTAQIISYTPLGLNIDINSKLYECGRRTHVVCYYTVP